MAATLGKVNQGSRTPRVAFLSGSNAPSRPGSQTPGATRIPAPSHRLARPEPRPHPAPVNPPSRSAGRSRALAALLALAALALARPALQAADNPAQGTPEPRTPAAEARSKIGQEAVVAGTLSQVTRRERIWYLNLDGRHPTNAFTAVVFPRNFGSFTNLDPLVGRRIELTGKVTEYQGKPQMILERPSQLREADAPATTR